MKKLLTYGSNSHDEDNDIDQFTKMMIPGMKHEDRRNTSLKPILNILRLPKPKRLNSHFRVLSYDGGSEDNRKSLAVDSVLILKNYHCSDIGKNLNLVLEFKKNGYFKLTNFSVMAPYSCTAPIHTGVLFVSKTRPKIESYSGFYDNIQNESSFKKLLKKRQQSGSPETRKAYFFKTDNKLYQAEMAFPYPTGVVGKYLHIKFISSHADVNIDVETIGIIGFPKRRVGTYERFKKIPLDFKVTRSHNDFYGEKWNLIGLLRNNKRPKISELKKHLSKIDVDERFFRGSCTLMHVVCLYPVENRKKIMKYVFKAGVRLNVADSSGRTEMHYLIKNAVDIEEIQLLESLGSKIYAVSNKKESTFHVACYHQPVEVVEYIHQKIMSKRKNFDINEKTSGNLTPMDYAILSLKHEDSVNKINYLRQNGVSFDKGNNFHVACLNSKIPFSFIQNLVEKHKFVITEKDAFGISPFLYAVDNITNGEILEFLVKKAGSDGKKIHDKEGNNAYHYAANQNNCAAVKVLQCYYPEMKHEVNIYGETALDYACQREKSFDCVKLLVLYGCDYRKKDKLGRLAFEKLKNHTHKQFFNLSSENREGDIRLKTLLSYTENLKWFKNFVSHELHFFDLGYLLLPGKEETTVLESLIHHPDDCKRFMTFLREINDTKLVDFSSPDLVLRKLEKEDEEILKYLYQTRNERFFQNFYFKGIRSIVELEEAVTSQPKLMKSVIPSRIRCEIFVKRMKGIFKSEAYESKYIINKDRVIEGDTLGAGQFGLVKSGKFYHKSSISGKNVSKNFVNVAIKEVVISKQFSKDDFLNEVKIMMNNQHPHIIKDDVGYMVLELARTDLYKMLMDKSKVLSHTDRLDMLIQISRGMSYLHLKKNVVHRDLKSLTEYLAPELLLNPEDVNEGNFNLKLVDIYSFGILIFETWSRKQPYHDLRKSVPDIFAFLKEVHSKNLRPNILKMEKCPVELIELMEACWDVHENRPESFEVIYHELKSIRKALRDGLTFV